MDYGRHRSTCECLHLHLDWDCRRGSCWAEVGVGVGALEHEHEHEHEHVEVQISSSISIRIRFGAGGVFRVVPASMRILDCHVHVLPSLPCACVGRSPRRWDSQGAAMTRVA
jgi:hypothetical protein